MANNLNRSQFSKSAADTMKLRENARNQWYKSETAKASGIRYPYQFRVKFELEPQLLSAVVSQDYEEVERLLIQGADVNFVNADSLTALHQACVEDDLKIVKLLVEHGADIQARDVEGWTPLHAAASRSISLDIVKYLVEKGADIAAVNAEFDLPIDLVETEEMRKYLREEMIKQRVDIETAKMAEKKAMEADALKWAQAGKIEVLDGPSKATPLHVAAAKGYVEVAKLLLKCGANPNAKDEDGWTPLHAAAHWDCKDTIKLLIENGADLNAVNNTFETPLMVADEAIQDYLKDFGAEDCVVLKPYNEVHEDYEPIKRKKIQLTSILKPYKLETEVEDLPPPKAVDLVKTTTNIQKPSQIILGPPKRATITQSSEYANLTKDFSLTSIQDNNIPTVPAKIAVPAKTQVDESKITKLITSTADSRSNLPQKIILQSPARPPLTKPIAYPPSSKIYSPDMPLTTSTTKDFVLPRAHSPASNLDEISQLKNEINNLKKIIEKIERENSSLLKERSELIKTIETFKNESSKKAEPAPVNQSSGVFKISRPPVRK